LALLLCSCGRGARCEGEVSQVTCHIWTGHVVPSWSEDYIISGTTVCAFVAGLKLPADAGRFVLPADPD